MGGLSMNFCHQKFTKFSTASKLSFSFRTIRSPSTKPLPSFSTNLHFLHINVSLSFLVYSLKFFYPLCTYCGPISCILCMLVCNEIWFLSLWPHIHHKGQLRFSLPHLFLFDYPNHLNILPYLN